MYAKCGPLVCMNVSLGACHGSEETFFDPLRIQNVMLCYISNHISPITSSPLFWLGVGDTRLMLTCNMIEDYLASYFKLKKLHSKKSNDFTSKQRDHISA